ncbi:MAG: CvpA family protein [Parcubacteria group bacterium]
MPTFDLILLALFLYFVFSGFWFGIVHTVGTLIGIVVGILAAGAFHETLGNFLQFLFFKGDVANSMSFIIIFLVVNQLVGFMFRMIDRAFKLVTIIPFLGSINRIAGAVLGIVVGVLVVGTMLTVASIYPFSNGFAYTMESSKLADIFISGASVLTALFPQNLRNLLGS